MDYLAQKQAIEATIEAEMEKMGAIMTKAASEKRTTSDAEEVEAEAIEKNVAKLKKNLQRVEDLINAQNIAKAAATPAAGLNEKQAAASAEGDINPEKAGKTMQVKSNLPAGIGFAKAMRARVAAQMELKDGNAVSALDIAKSRNEPEQVINFLQKDALVGRTDATEFAALVEEDTLTGEFVELLRARTVFDKLQGFKEVPFNTRMVRQLTGSTAGWVGEGAVKPVTNPTYDTIKIDEHKLAAISIFTDEFLRNSKPKADALFLEDLLIACAELIDGTFLGTAAGDLTKPAGILNGVTGITATGKTAETYEADLLALTAEFLANNKSLAGAQVIMSEVMANQLARLRDALGGRYYGGMQGAINAKSLDGLNVIESESAADKIIMIKPSELLLADDGRVDVSYSDQATIVNGEETLNLWQQNMSAVRVERFITWTKRRDTAVSFIDYSAL